MRIVEIDREHNRILLWADHGKKEMYAFLLFARLNNWIPNDTEIIVPKEIQKATMK